MEEEAFRNHFTMSQAQKTSKQGGPKGSTTVRRLIGLKHKEQKRSVVPISADSESTTRSKSNRTVINAVKLMLQALRAGSQISPLPGLSVAFDSLLTVIIKVETMSDNLEGFGDFLDRLNTLQSTLSRFDGTGKANTGLAHLLESLQRELESLRSDIDTAISRGRLERFINSTEDASSLATHSSRLDRIISQLTLDVTTSTNHRVDEVRRSVIRVENAVSGRSGPVVMGMTQVFRGANINTVGSENGTGGHVGSGNLGMHFQNFEKAHISAGGNIGCDNTSVGALEMEMAMRLMLARRSGIFV